MLLPIDSCKILISNIDHKKSESSQKIIKEQSINNKPIKRYECDICGKIFFRRILIIQHFRNSLCYPASSFDFYLCNSSGNSVSYINNSNDSGINNCIEDTTYKCTICHNIIKNNNLIRRQILHNKDSDLVCNICSMINTIACQNNHHLKETLTWKCKTCGQSSTKLSVLKAHRCIRPKNELFKCRKCHKSFLDLNTLEEHKIIHKLSCDVCHKQFFKQSSLTNHKRIHDLRSTNQYNVRPENLNSNVSSRSYKCSKCSIVFHKRWEILTHLFENHQEIYNKYSCDGCTHLCDSSRDLILHMEKNFFKCDVCPQSFTTSHRLQQHYRWHLGINSFKCYFCPKTFSKCSVYLSHEKNHTGERPFICSFCGEWFADSSNINIHLKSYKAFACNICQKSYTQKSSLLSHKRLHAREKYLETNSFNKTVNQLSTLEVRTRQQYTKRKQFKCNICDKRFFRLSTLSSHLITHKNHKNVKKSSLSQNKRPQENAICFKCSLCKVIFTDQNQLLNHSCISHICTCCQRVFNNDSSLKRHYRYMGQKNKKNRRKQNQFERKMSLKLNAKQTMYLNKEYKCDLCMKSFYNQSDIFTHILETHY